MSAYALAKKQYQIGLVTTGINEIYAGLAKLRQAASMDLSERGNDIAETILVPIEHRLAMKADNAVTLHDWLAALTAETPWGDK